MRSWEVNDFVYYLLKVGFIEIILDNQTVSSPLSLGMQWDSQLYAFVALVISFTVVVFLVATMQWLR